MPHFATIIIEAFAASVNLKNDGTSLFCSTKIRYAGMKPMTREETCLNRYRKIDAIVNCWYNKNIK